MAIYYVSTVGNDAGAGTVGDPWLTPQHAFDTAVAGDTVNYADGVYSFAVGIVININSGGAGNVITHQATNPGNVEFDLTANDWAMYFNGVNYVTMIGIEVSGDTGFAATKLVNINNSANLTFDTCEFRTTAQFCVQLIDSPNATFTDCTIHSDSFGDGDGIITTGLPSDGLTITGCTIYNVGHVGLNIRSSDDVTITDCEIYDCASHCVAFSNDPGRTVDNCIIDSCVIHGAGNYGALGATHKGIRTKGSGVSNITIQRNDVYACDGSGVFVWDTVTGPITIYNNTIYGNDTDLNDEPELYLFDSGPGGTPAVTIKNNILFKTLAAGHTMRIDVSLNTNVTTDYNLFYDSTATDTVRRGGVTYTFGNYVPAQETNSVASDNPDLNAPPGDMTLQVGSPAINAGVDIGLPFQGAAPDIGAHESSAGGSPIVVHVTAVVVSVVVVVVVVP